MVTDDNGYELAVCHQLGKAAKLRTGTRFNRTYPPIYPQLGDGWPELTNEMRGFDR